MEMDKVIIMKNLQTYDVENINPKILQFLHKRLEESEEFNEQELIEIKKKLTNLN